MTLRIDGVGPAGAPVSAVAGPGITAAPRAAAVVAKSQASSAGSPATSTPPVTNTAAGTDTVRAKPVDRLALAAKSAQRASVLQDAASRTLQRVHQIVTELQSLLDRGVTAISPPRGTVAERRYQALLAELDQLGHATAFQNPPVPTGVDVQKLADTVSKSDHAGLGRALQRVDDARQELTAQQQNTARLLEVLSSTIAAGRSSVVPIDTAAQARQLTDVTRGLIRRDSVGAVAAHTALAPVDGQRLLAG